MVDRGKADTLAVVLRGVNCGLHLQPEAGRRLVSLSVITSSDRTITFQVGIGPPAADAGQGLSHFHVPPTITAIARFSCRRGSEGAEFQSFPRPRRRILYIQALPQQGPRIMLNGVKRVRNRVLPVSHLEVIFHGRDFLGHSPVILIAGEPSADGNLHAKRRRYATAAVAGKGLMSFLAAALDKVVTACCVSEVSLSTVSKATGGCLIALSSEFGASASKMIAVAQGYSTPVSLKESPHRSYLRTSVSTSRSPKTAVHGKGNVNSLLPVSNSKPSTAGNAIVLQQGFCNTTLDLWECVFFRLADRRDDPPP